MHRLYLVFFYVPFVHLFTKQQYKQQYCCSGPSMLPAMCQANTPALLVTGTGTIPHSAHYHTGSCLNPICTMRLHRQYSAHRHYSNRRRYRGTPTLCMFVAFMCVNPAFFRGSSHCTLITAVALRALFVSFCRFFRCSLLQQLVWFVRVLRYPYSSTLNIALPHR